MKLLSVIVPCYNEEENVRDFYVEYAGMAGDFMMNYAGMQIFFMRNR